MLFNATCTLSPVLTTVTPLQIILSPVYVIHCESNVSEHICAAGHSIGVGHGSGVVR
jgi:hypothetical protein